MYSFIVFWRSKHNPKNKGGWIVTATDLHEAVKYFEQTHTHDSEVKGVMLYNESSPNLRHSWKMD